MEPTIKAQDIIAATRSIAFTDRFFFIVRPLFVVRGGVQGSARGPPQFLPCHLVT